MYSVTLGETTPIPLSIFDNSSSVSLEITVAGTTLSPQTDILSVAYAYKAEKSVDTEQIAGNNVSTAAPTTDEVLKWNGTQWSPQADNGLTLPYTGSLSGSGGVSNAIFEIYQPNGTATVIYAATDGTGKAGRFTSDASNADVTVSIESWSNIEAALEVDNSGSGGAAYFWGDVEMWDDLNINGTISKSSGTFKIDHPLDPENKYLYHSFVESPDMMNVYNGNIALDNNGEAIVELPEYFDVLNKDFRYQLTCIGGFAPVFISEKISGNSFKIAGGASGMEVSWQITGIRQDPYANQNRIQVEVEKSEKEKGHYLHYKEYNQPVEKSIEAVKNPEILEKLNK